MELNLKSNLKCHYTLREPSMLDSTDRKMLYAFLSMLFRRPDEETVASLQGVSGSTFDPVFPGLTAPPVPPLAELQEGYQYLFGERPDGALAPPYGSVYLESAGNVGVFTRFVSTFYASAGLDTRASAEPVDYLPTELEFLYYLTEGEERSLAQEIDTPPQRWLASQAEFLHGAVASWVQVFCERIDEEQGAHPFYRWAAALLCLFVEMEKERLRIV
jgi:putative dimethyl sulfoxide reductase chaperone